MTLRRFRPTIVRSLPVSRSGYGRRAIIGRVGYHQWHHSGMAMTLRLADDEAEALRRRAELESRSMHEVARQAIREYIEHHSRGDRLDRVLDQELPRYAEALLRLGESST